MNEHNKEECYDDLCLECAEVEEVNFAKHPEAGVGWYEGYWDGFYSNYDEGDEDE